MNHPLKRKIWTWVPTLYFYEAIPFSLVTAATTVFFKNLGFPNSKVTFYSSAFSVPWILKSLWSPWISARSTPRRWVLFSQCALWIAVALLSLSMESSNVLQVSIPFLSLIAILGATHDVSGDGLYIQALTPNEQSFWIGIRNTFFRLGMFFVQGALVAYVGIRMSQGLTAESAWKIGFGWIALTLLLLAIYHYFTLPPLRVASAPKSSWKGVFSAYFKRPGFYSVLPFMLFFRLGEAQLLKLAAPFLLDPMSVGGLGLNNQQVGFLIGTWNPICLSIGGILGGLVLSKGSLKKWLLPMAVALNLPHLLYLILALAQPTHLAWISVSMGIEQFFYGFGFAGYMLYLIRMSQGEHPTANYAISSGIMICGLMLPGLWSGKLQMSLGYPLFFAWVFFCSLPSLATTWVASKELYRFEAPQPER